MVKSKVLHNSFVGTKSIISSDSKGEKQETSVMQGFLNFVGFGRKDP